MYVLAHASCVHALVCARERDQGIESFTIAGLHYAVSECVEGYIRIGIYKFRHYFQSKV
jgi:hypothetical protein